MAERLALRERGADGVVAVGAVQLVLAGRRRPAVPPRSTAAAGAHDRRQRPRRAEIHAWQEVTRADRNARNANQLEE